MSYLKDVVTVCDDSTVALYLNIHEDTLNVEMGIVKTENFYSDENIFTDWLDIKSLRDVLFNYVEILDEHIKKGDRA